MRYLSVDSNTYEVHTKLFPTQISFIIAIISFVNAKELELKLLY